MQNRVLIFEDYESSFENLKMNTLYAVGTDFGSYCFVKSKNGLQFFKDSCPHLGVPFTQSGVCNLFGEIVCKEHGHRYSIKNGTEAEGRHECLVKINSEIVGNQLFLLF